MAKGSQLTQLKSALHQAGLTQQPQAGKKRKRAAPTEREKERRAERLKDIQQRLNPFDVKVTKLKHDVGGRKIVGVVGRPAQSKQAGIERVRNLRLAHLREGINPYHWLRLVQIEEGNTTEGVRGTGSCGRSHRPTLRR